MASHFKWYPSESETVVPFNARYSFPSQANKAVKMTPRIPPKTGGNFSAGSIIRLEFPAQGYVNPSNTTLEFDVVLKTGGGTDDICRFQNNIQSLFSRVRLLYGATPIEDIINYNQVVRMLTEWTGTTQIGTMDQTSIADGIGGVVEGVESDEATVRPRRRGLVNIRQAYIQGNDRSKNDQSACPTQSSGASIALSELIRHVQNGNGFGPIPNAILEPNPDEIIVRYQVNLALGLFTQEKLIPAKFMASQLAIEITLEQDAACLFYIGSDTDFATTKYTYEVRNVNLIPEILEFDASYDLMFLKGLQEGGVPIKFSSWHTFIFGTGGSSNLNLQIQERSRSVKALFAIQRRAPYSMRTDSGAMFFCSNLDDAATAVNTLQQYQFRIGGRYFPASPVQTSLSVGSPVPGSGAEAFIELQKALNIVGDYRLSTGVNKLKWAISPANATAYIGGYGTAHTGGFATTLPESDYCWTIAGFTGDGRPTYEVITTNSTGDAATVDATCFSGNAGSCCFAMAIDLETSNGVEISGLNAEEQSDISLIATYAKGQNASFVIEVYSYYDAMIILRENNVMELIQ